MWGVKGPKVGAHGFNHGQGLPGPYGKIMFLNYFAKVGVGHIL